MDTAEDWADARGYERGFADCSEVELHYVAAGSRESPLLLLLHGFPEFWYTWRRQLDPLAKEFFIVAPDLRGYNLSDRPDGVAAYGLSRLRRDLFQLIQAFDYGAAHVVGHDWGGALALSFARHHPAHVDRLVVANTLDPERPRAQIRGTQLLRSSYTAFFQLPWLPEKLLAAREFRALRELFEETAVPGAYTETDLERYRVAWERPGALSAALNYYRALGRTTCKQLMRMRGADRIYVPTCILWGNEDPALRPSVADDVAAGIDEPKLRRYPDATHWLHAEYPDRLTDDIREFLTAQ